MSHDMSAAALAARPPIVGERLTNMIEKNGKNFDPNARHNCECIDVDLDVVMSSWGVKGMRTWRATWRDLDTGHMWHSGPSQPYALWPAPGNPLAQRAPRKSNKGMLGNTAEGTAKLDRIEHKLDFLIDALGAAEVIDPVEAEDLK